ncbi:hypothetical protein CX658_18860 [Pseudomonas amygdali pv. lachrymans]|nr:hypothetical protein CX658_18860 [Pseudomonas amygdali pv. lachrymans]
MQIVLYCFFSLTFEKLLSELGGFIVECHRNSILGRASATVCFIDRGFPAGVDHILKYLSHRASEEVRVISTDAQFSAGSTTKVFRFSRGTQQEAS